MTQPTPPAAGGRYYRVGGKQLTAAEYAKQTKPATAKAKASAKATEGDNPQ